MSPDPRSGWQRSGLVARLGYQSAGNRQTALGREPDEGISIRSKAARRHFRLRLKHLDSKRPRIHPRRPSIKKRANYRTNQIDAIGPTEVKKMAPRIRNKRWSTWMAESLEYRFGGKEPATLCRHSGSSNYWNFVRCLLYDRDWHGGGRKLSC